VLAGYRLLDGDLPPAELEALREVCSRVAVRGLDRSGAVAAALDELVTGLWTMLGVRPAVMPVPAEPGPAGPGGAARPPHVLIAGPSGASAPAVTH
jgi:hypothetical protein